MFEYEIQGGQDTLYPRRFKVTLSQEYFFKGTKTLGMRYRTIEGLNIHGHQNSLAIDMEALQHLKEVNRVFNVRGRVFNDWPKLIVYKFSKVVSKTAPCRGNRSFRGFPWIFVDFSQ